MMEDADERRSKVSGKLWVCTLSFFGQKGGGQSGGKPPEKKLRWGGLAVKGGQAELVGGILFINR